MRKPGLMSGFSRPRLFVAAVVVATLSAVTIWGHRSGIAADVGVQHQHAVNPRAAVSGVMSLDVYSHGGTLHLLTGVNDAGGARSLWYRRSLDEGKTWTSPVRVDEHAPVAMFRRGNDAQIAASDDLLVAVWTRTGTGWGGGGPLASALSRDGGKTWQPAGAPADDNSTTTHAFSELFRSGEGFGLAWIDNRGGKSGVRYAELVSAGANWSKNVTIEPLSCECCWNSAASKGSRVFLMYRANMPRDMMLAESSDKVHWQRIGAVGAYDWKIEACPETGGSIAFAPNGAMHALAWTGKDGKLGLHYLISRNEGRSWSEMRRMGSEDARRSDFAVAGDGTLAAAWDDTGDNRIRVALSRNDGTTWSDPQAVSRIGNRALGPRVVPVVGGFRVFWTEASGANLNYEWMSERIAP